jgi:hypothetical protein
MKGYYFYAAVIAAVILSGCAKKTAYEVFGRQEQAMGLSVSYRVGVPANPSREDLQSWCDEITTSEGDNTAVVIEFVDKTIVSKQQGFCLGGELNTIAELNQMPALPSHTQEVPLN